MSPHWPGAWSSGKRHIDLSWPCCPDMENRYTGRKSASARGSFRDRRRRVAVRRIELSKKTLNREDRFDPGGDYRRA
jgi:hypothetical protein